MITERKGKVQLERVTKQEKLEIRLTPELVERMDEAIELLDLGSREELVRCAIRRYVDRYYIIPKGNTSMK